MGLVGAGGLCLTKRLRQRRRSCVMRCSRVSDSGVGVGVDVGVVGEEVVGGSVVEGEVVLVVGGDGGNVASMPDLFHQNQDFRNTRYDFS